MAGADCNVEEIGRENALSPPKAEVEEVAPSAPARDDMPKERGAVAELEQKRWGLHLKMMRRQKGCCHLQLPWEQEKRTLVLAFLTETQGGKGHSRRSGSRKCQCGYSCKRRSRS